MKDRTLMDEGKPQRAIQALQRFLGTPLDRLIEKSDDAEAETAALSLFHDVARRVPAYRQFLEERGIDPASIRSAADFSTLPLTDKTNYLQRHLLAELCRDGRLD